MMLKEINRRFYPERFQIFQLTLLLAECVISMKSGHAYDTLQTDLEFNSTIMNSTVTLETNTMHVTHHTNVNTTVLLEANAKYVTHIKNSKIHLEASILSTASYTNVNATVLLETSAKNITHHIIVNNTVTLQTNGKYVTFYTNMKGKVPLKNNTLNVRRITNVNTTPNKSKSAWLLDSAKTKMKQTDILPEINLKIQSVSIGKIPDAVIVTSNGQHLIQSEERLRIQKQTNSVRRQDNVVSAEISQNKFIVTRQSQATMMTTQYDTSFQSKQRHTTTTRSLLETFLHSRQSFAKMASPQHETFLHSRQSFAKMASLQHETFHYSRQRFAKMASLQHETFPKSKDLCTESPILVILTDLNGTVEVPFNFKSCTMVRHYQIDFHKKYGVVLHILSVTGPPGDSLSVYKGTLVTENQLLREVRSEYNNVNNASSLFVNSNQVLIRVTTASFSVQYVSKFIFMFTAHPLTDLHTELNFNISAMYRESKYIFDCSVTLNIPQVIKCDMVRQCAGGEDEENCAYRHPGCKDWIPYKDKCLKFIFINLREMSLGEVVPTAPRIAATRCKSDFGAELALVPDKMGFEMVERILQQAGYKSVALGLTKYMPVNSRLSYLYRFLWQWGGRGGLIAHNETLIQYSGADCECAMLVNDPILSIEPTSCVYYESISVPDGYICMKTNSLLTNPSPRRSLSLHFKPPSKRFEKFSTKECSDGSRAQRFHSCYHGNEYSNVDKYVITTSFFDCTNGAKIHYTMVCDGHVDCSDKSDELNCQVGLFPPLKEKTFICVNSQTIHFTIRCNGIPDCFDHSDEVDCGICHGDMISCRKLGCIHLHLAPNFKSCPEISLFSYKYQSCYDTAMITLNGYGNSLSECKPSCPETHFQCIDWLCIPTFLVNNGEQDCYHGDDENIPPENFTCPGFYRCHLYTICVHSDFLCDGVYHCPNMDDEIYCDLHCPVNCSCEGHGYKCGEMFDPLQHLQLRYLDISGTLEPHLENMHVMEYLHFLNLSSCNLISVNIRQLYHLQILDLSFNRVSSIMLLNLESLDNLLHLNLSHNPLFLKCDPAFRSFITNAAIVKLESFILRDTGIQVISENMFEQFSNLKFLDVSMNQFEIFDKNTLRRLNSLQILKSDVRKLCCPYFQPRKIECFSPVNELSSCSDLLRSDFFRAFLWIISLCALGGNCGVLIYRLLLDRQKPSRGYRVMVSNLCVADLLMGVYMTIIGSADVHFRGVYVTKESEWTDSVLCHTAGFLALVSSEVSIFIISIITLDRIMAIWSPLNTRLHMTKHSTLALVSSTVWLLGFLLATVPLLPFNTHWKFYSQTGICLPLPITRKKFSGELYAFSIFIVLNFVIFVMIGVGQVVILSAVRNSAMAVKSKRSDQEIAIALQLFLIIFSNFCCWFPIGLMGLLASTGTIIPGEVNTLAAIFILPLNSALNPFLFTLNTVLERWRKKRLEYRLMHMMTTLKVDILQWPLENVHEVLNYCAKTNLLQKDSLLSLEEKSESK